MRRPSQLVYAVEDKPSLATLIMLGLQYVVVVSAFLLLPVIVMQQAHVDSQLAAGVISIAMLVAGLTGILQVFKKGLFGSGYLLLASPNPIYIAPSIIAIQMGGLPLVFGMTLLAGIFQAILAPFFKELQKFFPAEIGGLITALIGVETGTLGINDFINSFHLPVPHTVLPPLLSLLTLVIVLIMTLWGSKTFRLYALIIALILGYALIYVSGCMNPTDIMQIKQAPWFALPIFPTFSLGMSFNPSLLVAFGIAALAGSIKVSGAVTSLQRLNDADWIKPEMKSISRGNLIDSLGTILCGLLGSFGQNVSSSSLGVSLSSGVGCRRVAYPFAAVFALLSFSPKFALILVLTPSSIVAAILIFLAATLFVTGLKTIIPRMTVSHRAVVIGISFILGISRDIYPHAYENLPGVLQALTGSSIAFATICAIVLNFLTLLSTDNTKTAQISLRGDLSEYHEGEKYLINLQKTWDFPMILLEHVRETYASLLNAIITHSGPIKDFIVLEVKLTRSELNLGVVYRGKLLKLVNQKDSHSKGLEHADEVFIPHASSVSFFCEDNTSSLQVVFDY